MSNYAAGHQAEKFAADFVKKKGFKIVALNWRNRYCEIDIVAQKRRTIDFIEVKYRQTQAQGTGFDYITAAKLERMKRAAEYWIAEYGWKHEYALGAIELQGANFEVKDFIAAIDS